MIPKTLKSIADSYGLTAHLLKYKMYGAKGGYVKGYSLVNGSSYEQLEIEPIQGKSDVKYIVRDLTSSSSFFIKNFSDLAKKLKARSFQPISRTGVLFRK